MSILVTVTQESSVGEATLSEDVVELTLGVGSPGPKGDKGDTGDTGAQGPQGDQGDTGDKGWSPVFSVQSDGERRVLQVDDWVGGEGTKPATGDYVGSTGLVAAIGDAVDIRGDAGADGADGEDGEMAGPASAVDENIAVFDGTDGSTVKDGGSAISDLATQAALDAHEASVGQHDDVNLSGQSNGQFLQRQSGVWVPKSLVKGDVGLGNVENFGIATQGEAEAGTASDKYMTPQRTSQAIDALAGGGGDDTWGAALATEELASDGAAIDFSSISSTFRSFRLDFFVWLENIRALWIRVNNDSGSNYQSRAEQSGSNSSSAAAIAQSSTSSHVKVTGQTFSDGDSLIVGRIWVSKRVAGDVGIIRGWSKYTRSSVAYAVNAVGLWNNTSDLIDQLTLVTSSADNFRAGSLAILYGKEV